MLLSRWRKFYSSSKQKKSFSFSEMIAQRSPVAVQGTKVVMNYARDHSVADGLNHIAEWNSAMLQSADLMQSAQAAMMKQPLKDVDFDNL